MKLLSQKFLILCGFAFILSACGTSNSSSWAKKSSPWEKQSSSYRKNIDVEASAADSYKEELAAVDQSLQEVELSYQAEHVDSFVPETDEIEVDAITQEPEVVEAIIEESVTDDVNNTDDILALPGDYYTLQLMASVDMDRVNKFADKNQLSTRYIAETHRGDTIWYVLLLDVYPDYSSAKAAMNEIADVLQTTPWVRKLSGIQKLMR